MSSSPDDDPEDEDFEEGEPDNQLERFSCLLQQALSSGDCDGLATAARVLGHLARVRGSMAAEPVELELRRSLEWLQQDHPAEPSRHRHAACLVITELAENAPTLLFVHIREVFAHLWTAVRDARLAVREAATRALRACLRVVSQRERKLVAQWYECVYDNAMHVIRRHATAARNSRPRPSPITRDTAPSASRLRLAAQFHFRRRDPRLPARTGRAARLARRAESQRGCVPLPLTAAVRRGVRSRVGREGAPRATGSPCHS